MTPTIALVTGASGFVGSHLVRRLVGDGFAVHVLCRQGSSFWRLEDVLPRVVKHQVRLEDAERLADVLADVRPHHVFHLASATVVAGSSAAAADLVTGNLLGTVNLLAACDRTEYRGLVATGDSFEYAASNRPLRESDPCVPDTLHGITKLAATLHARSVALGRGRPIVSLRLFSAYGPGDNPRRLIPRLVAGALANTPLLLSRPGIGRDWVHVDDVVQLYLEAAREAVRLAGGVFNAGTGVRTDLGSVVDTVLRVTGSRAEARWGAFEAPPHDAHPWVADMSHTFARLAWRPRIPLEDGLRATIAAARSRSGAP